MAENEEEGVREQQGGADPQGGELFLDAEESEGLVVDLDEERERAAGGEEQDRTAELEARIAELEAERDQMRDRAMRAAADLENFRRRKEREAEEARRYGADKLIMELLPGVDNLERALEHADGASSDTGSIADGVRMVLKQMLASLEKHGVKSFEAVGHRFDPQRHEAIQQIESTEHETGTIVAEYQKGYFLHDRLLRPTLAVVAKRVEAPEPLTEPLESPAGSASEPDEEGEAVTESLGAAESESE